MTLFIQNAAGTIGTGPVTPLAGTAHMLAICGDPQYGEVVQPAPSNLIQCTYASPQTQTGATANRLFDLINTNFNVNPQNIDIVVVPGDSSFALNDGRLLSTVGGVSMPVGSANNPTTSVVVVYESLSSSNCVKGQASGDYDAPNPPSVILYHELSHARRAATNSSLDRNASGCDTSAEERAAEVDENDMRDFLGVPRRDVGDHCGDPGCDQGCCIVATVTSGSPYSAEVNALRQLRDGFLRRSHVGYRFFEDLHHDYYGFSPQVCRLMADRPELVDAIGTHFVQPLIRSLQLIQAYSRANCSPRQVGEQFAEGLASTPALRALALAEIDEARDVLSNLRRGRASVSRRLGDLGRLLRQRAAKSPYVRWALMDPIDLYLDALTRHLEGADPESIGQAFCEGVDDWGARMPLSEEWKSLSKYDIAQELEFLSAALLRSSATRSRFGRRLLDFFRGDGAVARLLDQAGYISEEVMA